MIDFKLKINRGNRLIFKKNFLNTNIIPNFLKDYDTTFTFKEVTIEKQLYLYHENNTFHLDEIEKISKKHHILHNFRVQFSLPIFFKSFTNEKVFWENVKKLLWINMFTKFNKIDWNPVKIFKPEQRENFINFLYGEDTLRNAKLEKVFSHSINRYTLLFLYEEAKKQNEELVINRNMSYRDFLVLFVNLMNSKDKSKDLYFKTCWETITFEYENQLIQNINNLLTNNTMNFKLDLEHYLEKFKEIDLSKFILNKDENIILEIEKSLQSLDINLLSTSSYQNFRNVFTQYGKEENILNIIYKRFDKKEFKDTYEFVKTIIEVFKELFITNLGKINYDNGHIKKPLLNELAFNDWIKNY